MEKRFSECCYQSLPSLNYSLDLGIPQSREQLLMSLNLSFYKTIVCSVYITTSSFFGLIGLSLLPT